MGSYSHAVFGRFIKSQQIKLVINDINLSGCILILMALNKTFFIIKDNHLGAILSFKKGKAQYFFGFKSGS